MILVKVREAIAEIVTRAVVVRNSGDLAVEVLVTAPPPPPPPPPPKKKSYSNIGGYRGRVTENPAGSRNDHHVRGSESQSN